MIKRVVLRGACAILIASAGITETRSGQVKWPARTAYESPVQDTAFSITDEQGIARQFYAESHAILILEGNYQSPSFPKVTEAADTSKRLLVDRLEKRGFHVIVWKDLTGQQLREVPERVFAIYGHRVDSRLFFYFFGHGKEAGRGTDGTGPQTYLVPVDAPDYRENEEEFYEKALPIIRLVNYASEGSAVRHSFFAFEACKAGNITYGRATLDGFPIVDSKGYLMNPDLLNPIRQFLTAGNELQNIPADNSFTALLAAGLESSEADSNHDGYITGKKLIHFISTRIDQIKQFYPLTPISMSFPLGSGGDFVFGAIDPRHPLRGDRTEEQVTRQPSLMGLPTEQFLEALHSKLAELRELDQSYTKEIERQENDAREMDKMMAWSDMLNYRPSLPGAPAVPALPQTNWAWMEAIGLRAQIRQNTLKLREIDFRYKFQNDIKLLRDELIRRGASLRNTPEITVSKSFEAINSIETGSLAEQNSLDLIVGYLAALGESLAAG